MLTILVDYWYYIAIATIGGVLGHMMRKLAGCRKIMVGETILQGASAAFAGTLILFACRAMGAPEELSGVLVGLCGWLGADASLMVLQTYIYRRLYIDKEHDDDKK